MIKMFLFPVMIILAACSAQTDQVKEINAIQNILRSERNAHFAKDVDAFLSHFADTVTTINHGNIYRETLADSKKHFTPYFESVTFQKWDDVQLPDIKISDDGTMAYATVEKTVVLTYPDSLGKPLYDSANYAWVSIYRKINKQWKLVCNASTQEECYD